MIFQEPMTSLNPVFTIGMQMMEVILAHEHGEPRRRRTDAPWRCSTWSAFPTPQRG